MTTPVFLSMTARRITLAMWGCLSCTPLWAQTPAVCQTPHVYWWVERTPPQVSAYSIRQVSTDNDALSEVEQKQRFDIIERADRFLAAFMSWGLFWDDAGGDLSDAQWQQRFSSFVAGTRQQWLDQVPNVGGIDEDIIEHTIPLRQTAKLTISTGIRQLCSDLEVQSVTQQGQDWIVTYAGQIAAVQTFCIDKKIQPPPTGNYGAYQDAQLKGMRWDRSARNQSYPIQVRLNHQLQVTAIDSADHTPFQIGNGYLLKDQKKQSYELLCAPTTKAFD